jgi:probable HAF family extracellular repeat protein
MTTRQHIRIFLIVLSFVLGISSMSYASYTFTEIDVRFAVRTDASGINDSGSIAGDYADSTGFHGFLDVGGHFTTIDVPGGISLVQGTFAVGINGSGDITGYYYDNIAVHSHGFLDAGGSFTTFDFPGASNTVPVGINGSDNIVGTYYDAALIAHGFLYAGGSFTTLDFPGATQTFAEGINDSGAIVGFYGAFTGNVVRGAHGFLYVGGSFTTLDFPGATSTVASGINSSGSIVGTYDDAAGIRHGFLYAAGSFTTIDFPDAQGTFCLGINSAGNIVGIWDDGTRIHGFEASHSNVMTWGLDDLGQLGIGTTIDSNVPVQVTGLNDVMAIAGGSGLSMALKLDGTVWSWGDNALGQLGIGTNTGPQTCAIGGSSRACSMAPVQVSGLRGAVAIAAGGYGHSIALESDGTVWAWGYNIFGQLGDGTNTGPQTCIIGNSSYACSMTPVRVIGLSGVAAISAGFYHSMALKLDGTVWTWGLNSFGQLGNGTNTNSNVPVQVSGLSNIVAIAGDAYHSMALKSDGTVWAWGDNEFGQLGNGTIINSNIPVQVSGLSGVVAIATGGFGHSMALKSDGTVWTWGDNEFGQLGNGTITNSNIPVQVTGLSNVAAIAEGFYHSLALKSDGTVRTWGYNASGQLGNGSNLPLYSSLPLQVSGLSNATAVAGGDGHSIAIAAPVGVFSFSPVVPLTIGVGGSASSTVTVNAANGFNSPVTLSVSGLPSGASATFAPNPVTPPAGGAASSTLTVSIAPFVTPTTFTLTITGTSGSVTQTTTATITVNATTASITNVIVQFLTAGLIDNSGIANALTSKLGAAQAAISAGNIKTVTNILSAFIHQVQAQCGKHIASFPSDPCAVLIKDVTALIDSLKMTMTPNPITGYIVNSSGAGILGATVSIVDSAGNVVAATTTDVTGFYFFATTGVLTTGSTYSVQVTATGFTVSVPAYQAFTWLGLTITLSSFVLS